MTLAVFDAETVAQLTANGIFRGAAYGILGVGFALILGVAHRFHFAYSFTYTLAAYLAFTFVDEGAPFWVGAIAAIMVVAVFATGVERFVYRPLAIRAGATALLAIFVASLGIAIAGENLIRWLWGSQSQSLVGPDAVVYQVWKVNFLNFDVFETVTAVVLAVALALLLRYTRLGRSIKAVRSNPELAHTIGIDYKRVYLVCMFIGTVLCGQAAVWFGLQFTVEPAMGLDPVIFAFIVAFLAGTSSSPIRILLTGVVVGLVEQYTSIWLSVRWTQTSVFVVLAAYLTWQSLRSFEPSAWLRAKLARV